MWGFQLTVLPWGIQTHSQTFPSWWVPTQTKPQADKIQQGRRAEGRRRRRDGLSPVTCLYQDSISACGWCFYIIRYKRVLIVIRHQSRQHKSSHQSIQSEHYHLYCHCLQIKQAPFSPVMNTTYIHFLFLSHLHVMVPLGQSSDSCNSTHSAFYSIENHRKTSRSPPNLSLIAHFPAGKIYKKWKKKGGKWLSGIYSSSMKPFVSCHFLLFSKPLIFIASTIAVFNKNKAKLNQMKSVTKTKGSCTA